MTGHRESLRWWLSDESSTMDFGRCMATQLHEGARILVSGELGAGKTTLCRGVLRAFGYQGAVKSPTFTLVEPYELPEICIYHFDLYRLAHAEELEYLGVDEYFAAGNLCFVEWPERARELLPSVDLEITLSVMGESRLISLGAASSKGEQIMAYVQENFAVGSSARDESR